MAAQWQRPTHVPLPSVWRRCRGARPMPDGRTPNFWIQDVTPDLDEQIVQFMSDSFLKEETFCNSAGVRDDPAALEEIQSYWRKLLLMRAALVALSDWPDGPDRPRLAGCNVTHVARRGHQSLPEPIHPRIQKVIQGMHFVEAKVDVFARFGVDEFLDALGLSVAPDFRGQGLGRELLLARTALGRALGLRLTVTVFTGVASQKQSARAGFEVLAEVRYDEYRVGGQPVFPDAPCDAFQFKAKRLDADENQDEEA